MPPQDAPVHFSIDEQPAVPVLGLLMGGVAMVPFVLLAAGLWLSPPEWSAAWLAWLIDWGGAILAFLAGVRRGLSFRTPGGERATQIVTTVWLYVLAALALMWPATPWRLGFLLAGYASLAIMDPLAAHRQEAPLFFARLRPVQMLVPIACLAAALLWVYRH